MIVLTIFRHVGIIYVHPDEVTLTIITRDNHDMREMYTGYTHS